MAQQDATANWKPLYLTGGIAALLAVFVFRRNLGAELSLLAMFGIVHGVPTTPLTSAGDWFRLFQENRLVALPQGPSPVGCARRLWPNAPLARASWRKHRSRRLSCQDLQERRQ